MQIDWLATGVALALATLVIMATVRMMHHREKMRAAAREAESTNVLSKDTRRAVRISTADRSDTWDHSSSGHDADGDDAD